MKKIIYILFYFYLAIFSNGCKENPVYSNAPLQNSIKKIWISDSHFTKYQFDGKLLTKKELISESETISSNTFTYGENGQLIRKDDYSNGAGVPLTAYITYEYSANNILMKTKAYLKINNDYEYRGYTLFEYEASRLIKYSIYNAVDELRSYHILTYENDNIVEDVQYNGNGNLEISETFEYDNKLNPLQKDKSFISAFTISKNNIVKWITTYYAITPNNSYTAVSSYTYNILGNPNKCITIYYRNENGSTNQDTTISYYEYY